MPDSSLPVSLDPTPREPMPEAPPAVLGQELMIVLLAAVFMVAAEARVIAPAAAARSRWSFGSRPPPPAC